MKKKLIIWLIVGLTLMAALIGGHFVMNSINFKLNVIEDSGVYVVLNSHYKGGKELDFNITLQQGYLLEKVTYDNETVQCYTNDNYDSLKSTSYGYTFNCHIDTKFKNANLEILTKDPQEVELNFNYSSDEASVYFTSSQNKIYAGYPIRFSAHEEEGFQILSAKKGETKIEVIDAGTTSERYIYLLPENENEVTIDINTVRDDNYLKVTYVGVEGATPIEEVEYYEKNSSLILGKYLFNLDEKYYIDYFNVNGETIDVYNEADPYAYHNYEYEYELGEEDITLSLSLGNNVKVTVLSSQYATAVDDVIYWLPNTSLGINGRYVLEDGYLIDTYNINGVDSSKYQQNISWQAVIFDDLGEEDITLSVTTIQANNKIILVAPDHTSVDQPATEYYSRTANLTLDSIFEVETGYEIDYYTVNGERVDVTNLDLTDSKYAGQEIVISAVLKVSE